MMVSIVFLCIAQWMTGQTREIRGTVIEKSTGEPMIGASVAIKSLSIGATVDIDGNYSLKAPPDTYTLSISYISFNTVELTDVIVEANKTTLANVAMEEAAMGLEEVVVYAVRRMNSEVSMIASIKASSLVVSAVSAQQIARTQDRDASEVVKRIPGISIIDNQFIVARGLSRRLAKHQRKVRAAQRGVFLYQSQHLYRSVKRRPSPTECKCN
jgi:hypothetical protein